jgi:hypothetical protein
MTAKEPQTWSPTSINRRHPMRNTQLLHRAICFDRWSSIHASPETDNQRTGCGAGGWGKAHSQLSAVGWCVLRMARRPPSPRLLAAPGRTAGLGQALGGRQGARSSLHRAHVCIRPRVSGMACPSLALSCGWLMHNPACHRLQAPLGLWPALSLPATMP